MPTKYMSSPSQAQVWITAMELTEKEIPTTNQTELLLKSSLLAIASFSRGNSSDIFQRQWCYSEPTQSAAKQIGFVLYHFYWKKNPKTSHKCTQRRYSQGNNREEVEKESCSFQLMKIRGKNLHICHKYTRGRKRSTASKDDTRVVF